MTSVYNELWWPLATKLFFRANKMLSQLLKIAWAYSATLKIVLPLAKTNYDGLQPQAAHSVTLMILWPVVTTNYGDHWPQN